MKDAIWLLKHLARTAALFALAWGIFTHFPLLYSEFAEAWHSPRAWLMRRIDRIPDVQWRYRISEHLPGLYRITWVCRLTDNGKTVAVLLPGTRVETKAKAFDVRCGDVTAAQLSPFSAVEISRNEKGDPMLFLLKGSVMHSRHPKQGVDFHLGEWRVEVPYTAKDTQLRLYRRPDFRINLLAMDPGGGNLRIHEPPFAAFKAEGLLLDGARPEQVEFDRLVKPYALDLHRASFVVNAEESP